MPIEPSPTPWVFPHASEADEAGVVGIGADLEPGTLLAAYRGGLFPMPVERRRLAWWSPDPRGVIPQGELVVRKSLRRSLSRYEIRIDTSFRDVVEACSDPRRPHGWITRGIVDAYAALHQLGWAHSVEAWDEQGQLVGGLYGVSINGLFAGESMFHRAPDASKVALVALVDLLGDADDGLLDVQWTTPHLETLGAVDIPRDDYLVRLERALQLPPPPAFA